jgi:tRNA (guanine-N7-)-methyltransferase
LSEDHEHLHRRRGTLYGRRKGKPLSARREGLLEDVLPGLKLDLTAPAPPSLSALFPVPVGDIRLEIGFGGGEHLLARAAAAPGEGFIGAEPFINGIAKAVSGILETDARNIRLHTDDATLLLDWLPDASLVEVDLLYPDPWPKKRHWKRRFVSEENLARLARVLRPGGLFRFASDVPSYVEWTLLKLRASPHFTWTAERADDWRKPWEGWPGTRYEATAIREGRVPTYLEFRRV